MSQLNTQHHTEYVIAREASFVLFDTKQNKTSLTKSYFAKVSRDKPHFVKTTRDKQSSIVDCLPRLSLVKRGHVTRRTSSFLAMTAIGVSMFVLPFVTHAGSIGKPVNNLGLVAYYSFDDASTTKATDLSGNGNTGTLTNGPLPATGRLGEGLSFDGVDDYVDVGSSLVLGTTGTISMWFKADSIGSKDYLWVYAYNASAPEIRFKIESGNLNFLGYDNGSYQFQLGTAFSDTNTWHHVVGIYGPNDARLYLDNSLVDSDNSVSINQHVSNTHQFGYATYDGAATHFHGEMDDIRIYNRALSVSEISNLYTYGATKIAKTKALNNLGLVGYWSFEDATGTTATDFSGNNNTGTLTNMTNADWVDGKNGKALEFDGVDDYVDIPDASVVPSDFTISGWFKKTSDTGDIQTIVTMEDYWSKYLRIDIDTSNYVSFYNYDGGSFNGGVGSTYILDGTWYFFTATRSGTNSSFYINGQIKGSETVGSIAASNGTNGFLGSRNAGSGTPYYFSGSIDEVRIYNRALSASEITDLYNSSQHAQTVVRTSQGDKLTDGLVAYYPMSGKDINGTTLKDRAGSNDGTLTNGPVPVIGKVGQGLSFDGVDDYVESSSSNFNFSNYITVSAWIRVAALPATDSFESIITKYGTNNPSTSGYDLRLQNIGGTQQVLLTGSSAGGSPADAIVNQTLIVGAWYLLTGTADGTNFNLYINGQLANSTAGTFTANSRPFHIGMVNFSDALGPIRFFNGDIDEVRIYNRALSATEVQQLYNLGR